MAETSEAPPDNALVHRVVQRLVAPGVVSRNALRPAQARLAPTRGAALVERLQRRAISADGARPALPLVRGTWSMPAESAGDATATARPSENAIGSSTPNVVARVPGPRVPSSSGVILRAPKDPRSGATPVMLSATKDRGPGATTPGATRKPAPVDLSAAKDLGPGPTTPGATEKMARAMPSVVTDLRPNATTRSVADRPVVMRRAAPLTPGMPVSSGSEATEDHRPRSSQAGLLRSAQSIDKLTRQSAPLILRKPNSAAHAAATPPSATHSTPAITPQPAASVIARTAAPGAAAAPHRPIPTPPHDIDWIAEQVGQRIARRLEIERERLGVRSWRP